jgi:3-hydroxybutyryl-CoA dehydrogenase
MKLKNIDNVAIIGTGMIGASMAVLFTGNGYETTVYATSDAGVARGKATYDKYYNDLIENRLVSAAQAVRCAKLLKFTKSFEDIEFADFIYECVVERLDVKHSVYKEVDRHCKKFKAIASATSAITVGDLAKGLTQRDKLCVAHPYNPPHLVPCVELAKGAHTSDEAVRFVVDVLESVGREVVQMRKEAPGFIGNRLQYALFREAVYMVEQGIATPEDIDRTLRSSFVPRYTQIGLFEHFDYTGLDMAANIEDYLFPTLCNANKAQEYIRHRTDSGALGFKTGVGVYDWSKIDIAKFRQRASQPYLQFFNWSLPEEEK